jgi:hypothetical protein
MLHKLRGKWFSTHLNVNFYIPTTPNELGEKFEINRSSKIIILLYI